MKQKLKRFMAGFMAMLTLVGTLFTNGTTAFAASPQANIAFWNASVKNSGEVSELKPGYNHGKILYSILDGNSAYCMNFGLRADGGQLMNSYDDASTSMSAQQRKLLSYCLYYGFNSTQKAAPSNSQCDEYIATQAMVWVIVADILEPEVVIRQQESSVTQHQVLILHTAIMRGSETISAVPTMQRFQVLHHAEPVRHQLMS